MENITLMLAHGDPAPPILLRCDDGTLFDLESERGRFVVVFFYPRDNTPGCTTENCDFSDLSDAFAALDVTVIGISPDSTASHVKFREKYGLTSRLAADPDHDVINAYGVWGEKKMSGRTYMGLKRTSFIIAPDGTIAEILPVARVKGHAAFVLDRVKALIPKT